MLNRRLRARKMVWNEREAMAANEWQFVDNVPSAKRKRRNRYFRTISMFESALELGIYTSYCQFNIVTATPVEPFVVPR